MMETTTYLNFDLLIQRAREGYRARVQHSPVGEAWQPFTLPRIEDVSTSLAFVGSNGGDQNTAQTFGAQLYATVFDGQVGNCLTRSLDAAERQSKGLRIRLRLNEVPELAQLPWEYLHDSDNKRSFVLSDQTPIVRYLEMQSSQQPLELARPLRILMVIANPYDFPPLDVEEEWQKVEEALSDLQQRGFVVVERLPEATLSALQKQLRQEEYHILHFIGHGWVDAITQQSGLVLENAKGRGHLVPASVLGTLLHDHRSLRLVLLNACQGARMTEKNPFAGTAQQLVQQGLSSVIAMQYPISDKAAIALTHEFYRALADGYPVDGALAEARKAIYGQQGHNFEWGTPVLFMRAPDGRLFDIEGVGEDAPAPGLSPYKGLQHFEEKDAERFFGREKLVGELLSHLQTERFLAVIGASGSGKSSLVRAGLIPALRRGEPLADDTLPPAGSHYWPIHVITPTADPLEALAASLTRDSQSVIPTDLLVNDFLQSPRALHLHVRKLLSQQTRRQSELDGPAFGHLSNSARRLLLVIDQFEELFTLCKDSKKQESFVENLLTAVTNDGPTVVVITLRADFYAQCAQFDELRRALERKQKYIGSMKGEELRQAIEGPADQEGWQLESGLVEQMLRDVGNEPGALPLLSHALLETWKRRRGRTLTFAGYAASGGVHGAIARTADYTLTQRLNEAQQPIARHIFLQLTELGEGTQDTRRRVAISDLIELDQEQDALKVQDVLQILADARLITTDVKSADVTHEARAEVAHEALIREWPTLRQWLDEDREGLRIHRQLNQDAQQWQALNRDSGALYRGARLAQALEWAETYVYQLNTLERRYLGSSKELVQREEIEREARLQRELEQEQALRKEAQAREQAEQERAEEAEKREQEQTRASYRLRTRNRVITVVGITALIAALLATFFGVEANASATDNKALAATSEIRAEQNAELAATNETVAQEKVAIASTAQAASTEVAIQRDEAEEQARIATIRQLAAQADATLEEFPQRSLLLALESLYLTQQTKKVDGFVANQAIRNGLTQTKGIALPGHGSSVGTVAISPDGQWLVITDSSDGTARLWNLEEPSANPLILRGHEAPIPSVAISPNGQWLVISSGDHIARLWKLEGTDPSADPLILRGHEDIISNVAISPGGQWLVTDSFDGTIRLWDLEATDPSADPLILRADEGTISSVAISPGGQWLVTSSGDNTARLWNLEATDPSADPLILRGHEGSISSVAISPDGQWLVTASFDGTARLWDLEATDPLAGSLILRGHEGHIDTVTISPDGQWLVTASSQDNAARLWNLEATDPSADPLILRGHDSNINTFAISPDGQWLVTAASSEDNAARLWDLEATDPSADPLILRGHEGFITDVAISPDGQWLVTGSWDHTARLWNLEATDPSADPLILRGHERPITDVAISPDGQWLVTGNLDGAARLWELDGTDSSAHPLILSGHEDIVTTVAMSPDGQWLATGSTDGTARLRNLEDPSANPLILRGHEKPIWDVAISPDGQRLVTGSTDGTARLWKLEDLSADPLILRAHEASISSVAISPDGQRLVTGSTDGTAHVWKLEDPSADPLILRGHEDTITTVAISPDGQWFVTASSDGTARLWNLEATDESADPLVLGGQGYDGIGDIAISPDGQWLVTASFDGTARRWDLEATDPLADPLILRAHEVGINSVAISPDGQWLVTGNSDGTARLSNLEDPSADALILRGHEKPIWDVAISPDGQWLVTGSEDQTARLWDLEATDPSADPLILRGHEGDISSVAISPDGQWLVTRSFEGTARLWALSASDLIDLACRKAGRNLTQTEWPQYFRGQPYRKTCENLPVHYTVAQSLLEEAKKLAREGDIGAAITMFEEALDLDSNLELEPESEAKRMAAEGLVERASQLAREDDIDAAITMFEKAFDLDSRLALEAKSIASGSLVGQAYHLAREG